MCVVRVELHCVVLQLWFSTSVAAKANSLTLFCYPHCLYKKSVSSGKTLNFVSIDLTLVQRNANVLFSLLFQNNIGHKLLVKQGWQEGQGLGKQLQGTVLLLSSHTLEPPCPCRRTLLIAFWGEGWCRWPLCLQNENGRLCRPLPTSLGHSQFSQIRFVFKHSATLGVSDNASSSACRAAQSTVFLRYMPFTHSPPHVCNEYSGLVIPRRVKTLRAFGWQPSHPVRNCYVVSNLIRLNLGGGGGKPRLVCRKCLA